VVNADVVRVQIDTEADFERYKGKLAGRIALTQPAREVRMLEGLIVSRMGEKEMEEALTTPIPRPRGGGAGRGGRGEAPAAGRGRGAGGGQNLQTRIQQFMKAEGVVAVFNRGGDNFMAAAGSDLSIQQQRTDGGTIFPSGGGSRTSDPQGGLPTVTLAVEHYNRMIRVLDKGIPVKVELNIETKFHEETTPNGFNTIAEIPGTDPVLKDGDAHPEDAWRQAPPHHSRGPLGRGRAGADGRACLRPRAPRRHGDAAGEARTREARGVLQLRQWNRQGAWCLAPEQPRGAAGLRNLDRPAS
jgi:hypothetical protein